MNYWLVKSEPETYSWDYFVSKGRDHWDGVRNYAARLNMMKMEIGDLVLFYHSNQGKEIVGIAKVVKEHYQDPTTTDARWVAVDLEPVEKLPQSVTLAQIKAEPRLQNIDLLRISRLSVQSLKQEDFELILSLAHN